MIAKAKYVIVFGPIKIGDVEGEGGREDNRRVDVREDRTIDHCSWFAALTCE